ncbi:Dead/deah box RNA helicase, partial [Globisporangium polare]
FYFVSNDIVTTIFKGDDSNYQQYYKYGKPAQVEKCSGGSSTSTSKSSTTASEASTTPTVTTSYDFSNINTTPSATKKSSSKNPKSSSSQSAGTKKEWEYCSTNSECANSCCSKKLSNDNMLKCTPGGC